MKKRSLFVIKAIIGGMISYAFPRLLIALGVPLETLIIVFGNWANINIDEEVAFWSIILISAVVVYSCIFIFDIKLTRLTQKLQRHRKDNKRIPIVDLLKSMRGQGWNMTGADNSECLDACDAIRQSALDGDLVFYGRKVEESSLRQRVLNHNPLERIPAEDWKECEIDCISCMKTNDKNSLFYDISDDNQWTQMYKPPHDYKYCDLHLMRVDVNRWINDFAAEYKGRRDKE